MTQGEKPHKQPPLATFAPSSRGNIAWRKVFVRVVSVDVTQIDAARAPSKAAILCGGWEGEGIGRFPPRD